VAMTVMPSLALRLQPGDWPGEGFAKPMAENSAKRMRPAPRPALRQAPLARTRELILAALEGMPVSVWLFGSWARGEARPSSDIDVAVLPTGEIPAGALARLRLALEESTIPQRVDLVDLRDVDDAFRRTVMKGGVVWRA